MKVKKKKILMKDVFFTISITLIMLLITKTLPFFTYNIKLLFYIFFVIPIFYLIFGAALAFILKKNLRLLKLIPVIFSTVSILNAFNISINTEIIFCSVLIIIGNYCFFAYAYNAVLIIIQKEEKLLQWKLDATFSWRLIAILIIFAFYIMISMPIKTKAYISLCKNYLQNKYHKTFSIDKARCNIWKLDYVLYFYPDSEPEVKFLSLLHFNNDNFTDYYKSVNYNWECYLLAKPFLDQITDDYFFWQKDIFLCPAFINNGKYKFDNKAWGEIFYKNTKPVSEVIKDYSGKLVYVCRIAFAFDLTNKNIDKVYKVVFRLIEKLKSENINYCQILLKFYTKKNLKNKTIREFCEKNTEPLGFYGYFPTDVISIDSNDCLIKINNWHDISKFLDKYSKSKITTN